MKFTKSLIAASLLAGASMAQAADLNATSAFLSVYDPVKGLTYDLNLDDAFGFNYASAPTHSQFTFNLASDPNWVTFTGGNNANLTNDGAVFAVAAQNLTAIDYTNTATPSYSSGTQLSGAATGISLDVSRVNQSLTASSDSALVTDANAALGGWASDSSALGSNFSNLWGTGQNVAASYGSQVSFYNVTGVTTGSGIHKTFTETNTWLGYWSVTGDTLTYATPVPAAVWMFGTGLIGLLGLNRRQK